MKKSGAFYKGILIGILIASLFLGSLWGAPVKNSISVVFNNIQVYLEGRKLDITDTAGKKAEAFVYNGSVYLPYTVVGKATGKIVSWDGVSQTLYVGSQSPWINQRGNTVGNLVNQGKAAKQGAWLYYSFYDYGTGLKLYKAKPDGSERVCLSQNMPSYINVVGDWIYYCNTNDNSRIYKIKTDGSNEQPVAMLAATSISVVGDWIYYINLETGSKIYKIKTDGTGNIKLTNDKAGCTSVVGDKLYYSNLSDGGRLYSIKTDGSGRTAIKDHDASYINAFEDWIYYISRYNGIYKVKPDGSTRIKLAPLGDYRDLNVAGDWVYYTDYKNGKTLYRVKTDGSGKQEICDDGVQQVNIIDDCIYFQNEKDGRQYSMKLDGSEKQKVEQNTIVYPGDRGNTSGNINNGGLIARQGDWLYYSSHKESRLYKVTVDGRYRTLLSAEDVRCINIVGDWIYYSSISDNFKLYKIKTDGTSKTKLSDDSTNYINVRGEWIYYTNKIENNAIYKMSTSGKNKALLSSNDAAFLNPLGDYIYYINKTDGRKIYKVRADGLIDAQVAEWETAEFGATEFDMCRNDIYWVNDYNTQRMSQAGITTGDFYHDKLKTMNISEDCIYFANPQDGQKLYKLSLTNKQAKAQKLLDTAVYNINVVDDYIYFKDQPEGESLYRVKKDGSDKQLFD